MPLIPTLVPTPGSPPTHNPSMAETFSWVPVQGAGRPLYAQATYSVNPVSATITGGITVGAVEIKDGGGSGVVADVVAAGGGNAIRVLTQELDSIVDSITIGDIAGNKVTVDAVTSSLNVNVVNQLTGLDVNITSPVTIDPSSSVEMSFAQSPSLDAFGRLRTSNPFTLFDSSHRFSDNGLWATQTANGGTSVFNSNEGLVDLTVPAVANAAVSRETTKVFSYQPGKSLLVMNTFAMSPGQPGLRQRVGYGRTVPAEDGIFFQALGTGISIVRNSKSLGTQEIVAQVNWSEDTLQGTGGPTNPSGITLDPTKTQILWMDFEWLGSGTVRVGFVINGKFIICHKFHHANVKPTTYLSTACLPVTYEISRNASAGTATASIKQICTTVLSEGGYEPRGAENAIETPIIAPRALTLAGIYYPVITLRLKASREDAIVILSNLSFLGITNNAHYHWKLLNGAVTTGGTGTWVSAGANSSVQYKMDATSVSGGRVLISGFSVGSNQGSTTTSIQKDDLFRFQLERDGLNNDYYEITLVAASDTPGADAYAALDWQEITR